MIFQSMSLEEAKKLYEMCKKESPETIVKIAIQDLEFFTDNFTKDYGNKKENEFLEDLLLEQKEQM